jgi:heme oxygenase
MSYTASNIAISPPLQRLRAATGELHRQLEGDLDILAHLAIGPARLRQVLRYRAFYTGAEAALAPPLAGVSDLETSLGARTACLAADLQALGAEPAIASRDIVALSVANRAEALGLLYVVEGSGLGGKVILRQLAAHGAPLTGLTFLDPHGADAGRVWARLLAVLARDLTSEADLAAAATGAIKGFAFAHACLVNEAVTA